MGLLITRLRAVALLSVGFAALLGAGDTAEPAARRGGCAPLSTRCRGPLAMTTRCADIEVTSTKIFTTVRHARELEILATREAIGTVGHYDHQQSW